MKRTLTAVGITAALVAGPAAAAHATQTTVTLGHQTVATSPSKEGAGQQVGRHGERPACGCEHHRSPGHHKAHHPRKPKHHKGTGHHPGKPGAHKPCPPKHHRHHHPKPPVVVVHPGKPVLTPPKTTPAARVRLTAATLPASLPRTGGASVDLAVIGGGALGAGALLLSLVWLTEPARRFNREAKR